MIDFNSSYIFNVSGENLSTYGNNFIDVAAQFKQACELNQYKMLEATQQLPSVAFYLAIFITAMLVIDLMILPRFTHPKFKWLEHVQHWPTKLALITTPMLLFIVYLVTYRPSPEYMQNTINPIIIGTIIFLVLVVLFDYRWIFIEMYKTLKNPPKENIENQKEEKENGNN